MNPRTATDFWIGILAAACLAATGCQGDGLTGPDVSGCCVDGGGTGGTGGGGSGGGTGGGSGGGTGGGSGGGTGGGSGGGSGAGGSTYRPTNLSGAWIVNLDPGYTPAVTSHHLCADPALRQKMWAGLEMQQDGQALQGQLQGGHGNLVGALSGKLVPPGGTGILQHDELLDFKGTAHVRLSGIDTQIETTFTAGLHLEPRVVEGTFTQLLVPDPATPVDHNSGCWVEGAFRWDRP